MTDSSTRVASIAGAGVAVFILAAQIVGSLWNYLFSTALFAQQGDEISNFPALTGGVVLGLIGAFFAAAVFGAGVFVSLRWIASISATEGWKRVIRGGVIAAALGAAASLVLGLLEAVIGSFSAGLHPLGYAFGPSFNSGFAQDRVVGAIGAAPGVFVEWLPLVVLAVVLLRLWLARHEKPATITTDA
ncbi:MAG TPA: hypothetical protein VGM94_00445 [Galbitalea sp.]|jgi:hypothetical protein